MLVKMVREHMWCSVILNKDGGGGGVRKKKGDLKKRKEIALSECWLLECCDTQFSLFDFDLPIF